MLTIRMQRTGRSGHAQFRVVVQDSRFTPTSGRVVAAIGSYNPHTKASQLDKEKAAHYLENGAQPSPRVIKLLVAEGVTLPTWVKQATNEKTRTTRNIEKLRKNRPAGAEAPVKESAEPATEETANEEPAIVAEEAAEEVTTEEAAPAEEVTEEVEPAETPATAEEPTEATEEKAE